MGRPDALSREAGHERGENDNQGVVLLKPELFRVLLRATALDFEGEDESLVRRVKDCTAEREESVVKALLLKNRAVMTKIVHSIGICHKAIVVASHSR